MPNELIFAFQWPHRIGSVCCPPCPQCHESPGDLGRMYDGHGEVPKQPVLIVRAASHKEWLAFSRKMGATLSTKSRFDYYYAVQTD